MFDVTFHFNAETKEVSATAERSALDVPAALEIISNLEVDTYSNWYYIQGVITSISSIDVNDGRATFVIKSPDAPEQVLTVDRIWGFNGNSIDDENLLMIGDHVEIYGRLMNNNGKPQIRYGGHLVLINGAQTISDYSNFGEGSVFDYGTSTSLNNCSMTFGAEGVQSNSFSAATYYYLNNYFWAYTPGNGIDGELEGGTYYTFKPVIDGAITVAVVLNADKAFYVEEDGVALADFNGITVPEKYYGTFTFPVQAGKTYKVYCAGSKLGYYGFKFSYTVGETDITKLLASLQNQLTASQSVLDALTYNSVPGASELSELVSTVSANMETYDDANTIRNIIRELANKTEIVNQLNSTYKAIEAAILRVESITNEYMNPAMKEEAEAYFSTVREALGLGGYELDEAQAVLDRINNYYAPALEAITLSIHVSVAGTLGDLILEQVENFADVGGLIVSGSLNSDDQTTLQTFLTNVEYLDLSETSITELQQNIFKGRANLKTIRLPKKLKTIGAYAFQGCTNLQDFEYPTTLQTIGSYAFSRCPSLTKAIIPEGVTSIGYEAYVNYTSEYWDESQQRYIRIEPKLTTVSLPSTLISMGNWAFEQNINLTNVIIAEGITKIAYGAFAGCTKLSELNLPSTLLSIEGNAFSSCQGLKKLVLPESMTSLGNYAFGYCNNLQEVIMGSNMSYIEIAFSNCENLTSITLNAIVPPNTNNNYVMDGNHESQCTLNVPALVAESYKQNGFWSLFNIVGVKTDVTDITITSSFKLNWTEEMSEEYHPNIWLTRMDRGDNYGYRDRFNFGALTLNGKGVLSANTFQNFYDNYSQYRYNNDSDVWYTSLINRGKMRADNVSTQMTLYAEQWNFISLPYDVKVADIKSAESDPFVIRRYDGEQRAAGNMNDTWVDMNGDDILKAGKGYIWMAAATTENTDNYCRTFTTEAIQNDLNKNNIFNSEDAVIALDEYLSEFTHNRSWNLVGNPYPCYYDTRAMNTKAPFIVWEMRNRNYKAYSPVDDQYILKPGEAFFIQRPLNVESITLLKEGRQTNCVVSEENEYNTNRAPQQSERYVFNLTLTGDNDLADQTRFVINPEAKMDYEIGRDASKFMSTVASAAQLYTLEQDKRFSINERPVANGIFELGMIIGTAGTYTITLKDETDAEVYLVNNETGEEIRLDGTEGYTFYAAKGTMEGRFVIRVAGGNVTGISNISSDVQTGQIYDLQGRRVNDATRKGLYIKNGKKAVVK
jgi:hypothetical protein